MTYAATRSPDQFPQPKWTVAAPGDRNEHIFYGPDAEVRAKEYAAFLSHHIRKGKLMPEPEWQRIDTAPENVVVMTKIDEADGCRNEQQLVRQGRMWFLKDKSMYAYYVPTHWRPIP